MSLFHQYNVQLSWSVEKLDYLEKDRLRGGGDRDWEVTRRRDGESEGDSNRDLDLDRDLGVRLLRSASGLCKKVLSIKKNILNINMNQWLKLTPKQFCLICKLVCLATCLSKNHDDHQINAKAGDKQLGVIQRSDLVTPGSHRVQHLQGLVQCIAHFFTLVNFLTMAVLNVDNFIAEKAMTSNLTHQKYHLR